MFHSLLGIVLMVTGGHIFSTNLKLHHYSDEDYIDILSIRHRKSVTKYCTRHSESEVVKKLRRWNTDGGTKTVYRVTSLEQ